MKLDKPTLLRLALVLGGCVVLYWALCNLALAFIVLVIGAVCFLPSSAAVSAPACAASQSASFIPYTPFSTFGQMILCI